MIWFVLEKIQNDEATLGLDMDQKGNLFNPSSVLGKGIMLQDPKTKEWEVCLGNFLPAGRALTRTLGLRSYLLISDLEIAFCFDTEIGIDSVIADTVEALRHVLGVDLHIDRVMAWDQMTKHDNHLVNLKDAVTEESLEEAAFVASISMLRHMRGLNFAEQVQALAFQLAELVDS